MSIKATIQAPNAVISVEFDEKEVIKEKLTEMGLPTDNVVVNGAPLTEGQTASAGDQIAALPTKNVTGNA